MNWGLVSGKKLLALETMSNTTAMQGMLYRTLGSTGENVSAIGIGGWHIGLNGVDEQLSIRIIRTAVDRGINFMDTRDDAEADTEHFDGNTTE